jgi:bifunctional UDP-N-acetylglucosamine pyrophosphorylase/glucosamine-1-phosphate N-acetyltransferase
MDIQTIILAAGKGSRMKSELPKVLHCLAGKPLVQHVIDSCQSLGATHCHLVVGHGSELVREKIDGGKLSITYAEQTEQLGTGHAVKMALPALSDNAPTLILYGDVPLIHADTLAQLVKLYEENPQGIALMTCDFNDPTGYGRIVRDENNQVTGIVEQKDANDQQKLITEINTGILCCNSDQLKKWIGQLNNDNAQQEYYLTDIIEMAAKDGQRIDTAQPVNLYEIEGINTLRQLSELERTWQRELANQLMEAGVTLLDPNRFDIRGKLTCGTAVTIDINFIAEGNVTIEKGAKIGANVILKNCTVGANSEIKPNSIVEDSMIGTNCSVGPFARLRPLTEMQNNSHVGNFVEIKKSTLGEGTKAGHLSYIGDSEIGQNVNVGAGTITCNYDGANKFKTIIEDDAFIGSDTQLIAPVTVGKGATIGAGTTVSNDVQPGALCISRVKQKQIEDWARPTKNK